MKRIGKKICLLGMIVFGCVMMFQTQKTEGAVKSQSVTVTLDKKNPAKIVQVKSILKESEFKNIKNYEKFTNKNKLYIKIEVLEMTGKVSGNVKKINTCAAGSRMSSGYEIENCPVKVFKRGYVTESDWNIGDTAIECNLSDIKGVSKISYKITVSGNKGNKVIKSIKVKNMK